MAERGRLRPTSEERRILCLHRNESIFVYPLVVPLFNALTNATQDLWTAAPGFEGLKQPGEYAGKLSGKNANGHKAA